MKIETTFPPPEKHRLADQLNRSSSGINSAIAEGHGKFYYKDQINCCVIARGCVSETLNHLIVAVNAEYIIKAELAS